MIRSCLFALISGALVSGCATNAPVSDGTRSDATQVVARPIAANRILVAGRFAAKRGDAQVSGQFRYEQDGATRLLDLFTPSATQIARIEADANGARATLVNGERRDASSLSELLRQFIDIPISDAEFSSWLQGVPRSPSSVATFGRNGKIESFRESGWTIVVSSRFDGDAAFVRRMRWTFDADDASQAAEVRWAFDEFSTQ